MRPPETDLRPRCSSLRPLVLGAALVVALGLRSALSPSREGGASPPARRVVLISIDTLRPDYLGAYGYPGATSPTLDALAADGVRFARCVAPAPWTSPSHVSMLTGLYPNRSGIFGVGDELRPDTRTLAEEMRARGFATAAVIASELVLPCPRCRASFESVNEIPWRGDRAQNGPAIDDRGADVTAAALQWLGTRGARDRFFLFVHYYDVHSDYRPRPAMALRFGADPNDMRPGSTEYLAGRRFTGEVPPGDLEQMERLYAAEVRQVDDLLRQLFAFLRRRGWWDGTLVVVTADHGDEFLEHGGLLHGKTLYDEVLRVPMIMRGPGVPHGRVIPQVVSAVDVVPTILDAVGAPAGDGLDGRSLLALMRGDGDWVERAASEADQDRHKRMVRVGPWTLIENHGSAASVTTELYDVAHDPGEHEDLAAEHAEEVTALTESLRAALGEWTPHPVRPLGATMHERLHALGYVD